MSATRIADVVAQIEYPGGRRFVKVGALLKLDNNDESKGPGYMVMLDKWFNPAGVPSKMEDSIALSTYWPKEREEPPPARTPRPPHVRKPPSDIDDDIPF